jgi:hypothetical protein
MMAEQEAVTKALYRLAVLESCPLRTPSQLLEWYRLREWVLSDDNLLQKYRDQHYFTCSEEITKVEAPPKNSLPIFSRFLNFIFGK